MWSADSASFFSLLRTFSLPGMTMYSVSNSLSMSTPRVLLGRSFTWPSEASTVYPLPRYFWMVFALAGDSTITRPLDKISSVSLRVVLKLARMGARQQGAATNSQLSAISFQLANQGTEHTFLPES